MTNKGGRPKGVTVPQKERMIDQVVAIYAEMQTLRERAAEFERIIDEKNLQIKTMKKQLFGSYRDAIQEILTPAMAYGLLIREMRVDAGLTGQELAKKIYVSGPQLSKMEYGDPLVNYDSIVLTYEKMREMKKRGELKK